jgi:hypothetical protein
MHSNYTVWRPNQGSERAWKMEWGTTPGSTLFFGVGHLRCGSYSLVADILVPKLWMLVDEFLHELSTLSVIDDGNLHSS